MEHLIFLLVLGACYPVIDKFTSKYMDDENENKNNNNKN